MTTEIQRLSDLIAYSVSTLLQACEDCNTPFPDPNQPYTPQSEAFRANQVAIDATNIIAASALQLAVRVLPPHTSLMNIVSGLLENIKDPMTGRSVEQNHAPFNRAFNVETPFWVWYETQEQKYRRRRFAIAMRGIAQMQPSDVLDDVLEWKALPRGSTVVDVGGGIGTSSLAVAKKHDHLKFVVQDRPMTCTEATAYLSKEDFKIVETGRLSFSPHDFFNPQPVAKASVFILKQVLHGWSDPYCARILKELRAAATPETKLVVVDSIIAYACHDPTTDSGLNFGYKEAPAPLLPNYGAVNVLPYLLDLALDTLLRSTGWRIVSTERRAPPSNFYEPVVAVPV
ncbi:hypothetical protein C0993_003548 [Termitomyces sp. T159_Od127]|nr:hypothetical protein C0993_003548 [Termitomyces sp. T159_Od127]